MIVIKVIPPSLAPFAALLDQLLQLCDDVCPSTSPDCVIGNCQGIIVWPRKRAQPLYLFVHDTDAIMLKISHLLKYLQLSTWAAESICLKSTSFHDIPWSDEGSCVLSHVQFCHDIRGVDTSGNVQASGHRWFFCCYLIIELLSHRRCFLVSWAFHMLSLIQKF